jgi:hypothetical protein
MFDAFFAIMKNNPLVTLGSFSPFLAIFLAIYNWKFLSKASKFIFIFLVFYVITDIPLWITAALKIHNIFYSYLRDTLIIIFLAIIYTIRLKEKNKKILLYFLIALMVINFVFQLLVNEKSGDVLWISRLLLIFVSFGYFFNLIVDLKIKNILTYPFFWFNSGIIIFSLSSLLITFFHKFTVNINAKMDSYYLFSSILECISISLFLFFAIGFWVSRKNHKFLN